MELAEPPKELCLNPIVEEECPPAEARATRLVLSATRISRRGVLRRRIMRRDLRAIHAEGSAAALMVGVGESYLPAFVLAMGMGQVAAGLITTIPLMAGAVLQMVSPVAIRMLKSHRRWVILCAAIQAVSLLPMCAAAIVGELPVWAMFALAAVYWGAGMGTSAAWSTWVDTLIHERMRAPYFSRRTRFNQLATLTGFVVGGVSLQIGAAYDERLWAFSLLLFLAAACRFASTALLAIQSEPQQFSDTHLDVSMGEFVRRFRQAGDGRLLMYLLGVQAAAQIAGPYFTPYMLGPMNLPYATYVTLIAVSFAAKAMALPALGELARRFGSRRLLWIGGVGIVPISGLWLISNSFPFLVFVQVLAGITWAAYELAMFLLFFEAIRPDERTSMLTNFNFANSVATAAGSLLGGGILAFYGKQPEIYLLLFAMSSAARGLTLFALWRVPTDSAGIQEFPGTLELKTPERANIRQPETRRAA